MFLGSDALALAPLTRRITYLEEGDWVVVTSCTATIFSRRTGRWNARSEKPRPRSRRLAKATTAISCKKEIFEHPEVIGDTLNALNNPTTRTVNLPELPYSLA